MSDIIETLGGEEIGQSASVTKVALASWIGTTIEWYDFYLYGTAAALVFNKLFFPQFDPLVGTLAAFATFWVGFAARPIGGIVFGHFGDKIGRKSMLILTLLIMGISTFLIGLLPTYAVLGAWAAVLLVVLRSHQHDLGHIQGRQFDWNEEGEVRCDRTDRERWVFPQALCEVLCPFFEFLLQFLQFCGRGI